MPLPPAATTPKTYKVRDIITDALIEARWLAQGEVPRDDDAQFALRKLNDLVDEWAAKQIYAYNVNFSLFMLTPNKSPHTIGPANADFTAPRPVRIEGCDIVLNGTNPTTDIPINIRDDAWWLNNAVKGITSSIPTDLYYSPDYPNGSLYFWPVPSAAYQVRLEMWNSLSEFASLDTVLAVPPAYRKALKLTIATELDGPRSGDPQLNSQAVKARVALMGNNAKSPRISTVDAGMPNGRRRGYFNWKSGQPA